MTTARLLLIFGLAALPVAADAAQGRPADHATLEIELEGGAFWQSRNDVQIPNDASGTRFSLLDVTGEGAWPTGRLYLTWNVNERHGLRALLAPLSITETGSIGGPLDFAGERYLPDSPVEGTYQFNSWRIGYRYRFLHREDLRLWVGFTAKIRDAKIELTQGETSSRKTDVGFVPLLHFAADWNLAPRWHAVLDFEGLAGGPGRAFDVALELGRDVGDRWLVSAGYRTIEGGADVDSVYNFAWLHYAIASVIYRY